MDQQAEIEAVLAAERAWTDAYRRLDLAVIEQLMGDDYVQIRDDGALIDKRAALESLRSETRHWQFAASDAHAVRIYGDAAVVIGRWQAKGVNNGQPFDYAARFLSVYVKRENGWQIVTDQSTTIASDDHRH